MAGVKFEGVTKRFAAATVVDRLDLDIADKEFLVLVGPSGCGKSTTLRMLAGLEEVSEGRILIGGRIVNDLPPRERDIAMVFQSYALYPHKTVFENLAFGLRNRGYPDVQVRRRVHGVAETLAITGLLDRRPRHLSGGQRQRVALGRAIVREPAVFLMDEPLSNLDAQLRVTMRSELIKLHRRIETTVVYVTHDQVEALTMGSRIAVLKDGVLEQVGTADQLYHEPANRFVASFIGSPAMNFLNGRLQGTGGRLAFVAGDLAVPLERPPLAEHDGREGIVLGIRPEHLALEPAGAASAEPPPSGEVLYVEPMGGEALVGVDLGGREVVARVDGRRRRHVGERVALNVDRGQIHLFDARTGAAIRTAGSHR